jgi:hypothetical protein
MYSDDNSDSPSHNSGESAPLATPPEVEHFTLTREDTQILEEYIDSFQEGNTETRARIVAKAMAELAVLRSEDTPFNKALASTV